MPASNIKNNYTLLIISPKFIIFIRIILDGLDKIIESQLLKEVEDSFF